MQVEVAVEPLVVEEQLLAIGERVAVSAVGTSAQGVGEVLHRVHHSVECPHSLARISVGSVVDMRVADNHILPLRESRSHTAQPFVACGDCATCREEHIVVVGSLETEHNRKFLAGEVLRASGNEGVVEVGVVEREAQQHILGVFVHACIHHNHLKRGVVLRHHRRNEVGEVFRVVGGIDHNRERRQFLIGNFGNLFRRLSRHQEGASCSPSNYNYRGGNSGGGYCDVVNVEYYRVHRRISKS